MRGPAAEWQVSFLDLPYVVGLSSTDPERLLRPLAGSSTFAADDRAAGREYVSLLTHGKGIPSSRRRASRYHRPTTVGDGGCCLLTRKP